MGSSSRRRTTKSPRMSKAARQEMVILQNQAERTLSALDQSCESLRQLEEELNQFISDYYGKVGHYFEELARIEDELQAEELLARQVQAAQVTQAAARSFDAITHKTHSRTIERDMKSMYHDMAKRAHPDAAGDSADVEAMSRLNDAYARRNLGEMWKIKQELDDDKQSGRAKDRLEQMKAQHEQLQMALEEVEQMRRQLEESPASELMQRAFQMRLCGQDFIQQVTDHVQSQIADKKRKLVTTKIKHRYLDGGQQDAAL